MAKVWVIFAFTYLYETIFCVCVCVLVTQLCLTLWDTMERSSTVSSVHGILQARILEWVAIPFSRDLPDLGI